MTADREISVGATAAARGRVDMPGVRDRTLTGVAAPALSGYFLDNNVTFALRVLARMGFQDFYE